MWLRPAWATPTPRSPFACAHVIRTAAAADIFAQAREHRAAHRPHSPLSSLPTYTWSLLAKSPSLCPDEPLTWELGSKGQPNDKPMAGPSPRIHRLPSQLGLCSITTRQIAGLHAC